MSSSVGGGGRRGAAADQHVQQLRQLAGCGDAWGSASTHSGNLQSQWAVAVSTRCLCESPEACSRMLRALVKPLGTARADQLNTVAVADKDTLFVFKCTGM